MTQRLSRATLDRLPPAVGLPAPDFGHAPGIVHFGPGAFFRAHQADVIDRVLRTDPRWGIAAVALRTPGVRDALVPQDGLYTLAILDAEPSIRVNGAVRRLVVASEEPDAVRLLLASPDTHLVTMTVTEKGYCLAPDGSLDLTHPDIVHDLVDPHSPVSVVGWLVEGYGLRRAAGLPPFTAMSCDNLVGNGAKLRRAVLDFAGAVDADLAAWIAARARFPSTMVDSITPATDDALRERVRAGIGLDDAWPIQREAFAQWVIEDDFVGPRPPLEAAGATLTDDVAAFERAKLRLLNGPHSTLAYAGTLLGHATVAEAMADPPLARFVATMMRDDIRPTVAAPDLDRYCRAVLDRFRNPAIRHLLAQIAWDGSQKLPIRLLGTIADRLAAAERIDRLAVPIAAWMRFLAVRAAEGAAIVDPLADRLAALGGACSGDPDADVARFLALDAVFPPALAREPAFRAAVVGAYRGLLADPRDLLRSLTPSHDLPEAA